MNKAIASVSAYVKPASHSSAKLRSLSLSSLFLSLLSKQIPNSPLPINLSLLFPNQFNPDLSLPNPRSAKSFLDAMNYSLAEAYVMRKVNHEKFEKEEKEKANQTDSSPNYEAKRSSYGSSWLFRKMKIHPGSAKSSTTKQIDAIWIILDWTIINLTAFSSSLLSACFYSVISFVCNCNFVQFNRPNPIGAFV